MTTIYKIFLLVSIIVTVSSEECVKKEKEEITTMETQIKEHILCDYDKKERPVRDNKPVNITFYHLPDKITFSDYGGYISLDGSFVLAWKDEHLFWNPSDFDNKMSITLTTDEIWTPDLVVYNKGPYSNKEPFSSSSHCTVRYNKQVACILPTSIEGACTPDYRHWPLDTQRCTVKMGSWYHAGSEINFIQSKVVSFGVTSYEWDVKSLEAEVDPGIYKNYPNETFPTIKIQAVITRKFGQQFVNVVVPFLVLVSFTFITLSLDPRYSERIYFSTLSIPCHFMNLLQYIWSIPESGDTVPYILMYLRNSNVLASIILIETMIVRYLFSKQTISPPWLTNLIGIIVDNKVGKILLYREFKEPSKDLESTDGTLVEIEAKPTDWYILGRLIDSVLYFIAIIWYIVSFLICIT